VIAGSALAFTVGCKRPTGGEGANPVPLSPPTQQRPKAEQKVEFPALGTPKRVEKGVDSYEVALNRAGQSMRVWVYVSDHAPDQKLPLVLVGPAGSNLITGMALEDGDRAEHWPYARAGFAVVSYDIDGPMPKSKKPTDAAVLAAVTAFKDSEAGVLNARTALDFALARLPEVDPRRVYSAGHSSAATLSLLVGSAEPRIKACVAFAPATDVEERIGKATIRQLSALSPGYDVFMKESSPLTHVAELQCPVFLFHAKDDSTIPIEMTRRYAEALKRTNSQVTVSEVSKGGHYNSMIREGIPQAIEWLRTLGE
jgi:dienelactone hydrolase